MFFKLSRKFSTSITNVPIVDIAPYLNNSSKSLCNDVATALHDYGLLIIKDPRVTEFDNEQFLDIMEDYFITTANKFYNNEPVEDFFPNVAYRVGATPEFVERAKEFEEIVSRQSKKNKSVTPQPPPYDAKWRFFWPMGGETKNRRLIPSKYPNWEQQMDKWGKLLVDGVFTIAEMAAIGLDIEKDAFTSKLRDGPHLLAPTGCDLKRYNVGTIISGFHYDLNFLTIHGRSRFPGLYVWLRNGQKISVKVPEGHLLIQTGKQFEILTGGYIPSNYHEVIYTQEVKDRFTELYEQKNRWWRVSSTMFCHVNSEQFLEPINNFKTQYTNLIYPKIKAKDYMMSELKSINLRI